MNEEFECNDQRVANSRTVEPIVDVITIDDDDEIYVDDDIENDIEVIKEVIHKPKPIVTYVCHPNGFVDTSGESSTEDFNKSCDNCMQTTVETKVGSEVETNNEMKNVRKVEFQSITTSGSQTSTDDPEVVSTSDPTPPKVQRICEPSEPMPSNSKPKVDFETLYQNYLKSFRDRMIGLKATEELTEDLSKKFTEVYNKLKDKNMKFLESKQFAKIMEMFTKEVLEFIDENLVVRHHNDLLIELNRLTQNVRTNTTLKVKDKTKRIDELTNQLKKIQKQIFKAENEVLDYEAMERKNSFTDLPKLYRKAEEVWIKREELLKRSTNSGRVLFKRLKYDKTTYNDINKCVENLFNNHMKRLKSKTTKGYIDESFTFIDVRKAILEEIKSKQIVAMNCEEMIVNIYKDLMTELRTRHQEESEEVFETLKTYDDLKPETFVENDPKIDLEIAKNKTYFERKMNDLFTKYASEDRKKFGESVLIDGHTEWESGLVDDEDYESLDVKEGDLEEEDPEEEDKSDDEIIIIDTPVPQITPVVAPTEQVESSAQNMTQQEEPTHPEGPTPQTETNNTEENGLKEQTID